MNAEELRKLSYKELGERLDESKEELFNLRFQLVTNQLDNTARIKEVKRDIARVNTVMRSQEIAAWESQQEEA
ncbi:MAG: 50S ribosomal protein L29 [Actinomycetota bacterium]